MFTLKTLVAVALLNVSVHAAIHVDDQVYYKVVGGRNDQQVRGPFWVTDRSDAIEDTNGGHYRNITFTVPQGGMTFNGVRCDRDMVMNEAFLCKSTDYTTDADVPYMPKIKSDLGAECDRFPATGTRRRLAPDVSPYM